MSKDQTAPHALEQVRAFINTRDIELGTDELRGPGELSSWLREHGLIDAGARATDRDLGHAVALREAFRAIVLAHNDGGEIPAGAVQTLDDAVCRARLVLRFRDSGSAVLEPESDGVDAGLGRLLSIVQGAIADGSWSRLKACRLHTCEWAFYDHTKNRSGAWCNMAVCGNRAKARTYRERHATRA
jgi:predicted RNA-binding Zn ribbon-like protein